MKNLALLTTSLAIMFAGYCSKSSAQEDNKFLHQEIISVPRGEQAPRANPGQNNFGGMIPPAGAMQANRPRPNAQAAQRPPMQMARPAMQAGPRDMDITEISMSDPFIYADAETQTYYLTGTGGSLYKSKDLKTWNGPYNIIDLSGTWMQGNFVAAGEIHKYGDKYYYASTWNNHGVCIEQVPRRYNVPLNQTQLLVSDKVDGPYLPLVKDSTFCLGPVDWDIIDGTLYEENDTVYMVFVHEWTQLIDGTMDYFPLSKDLTHRTAEPTTMFRASEAAWSKEMNSIGEATFGLRMPGWV
ncbi:MAG: family 43 glycosylhydrolase, partial [Bacteroidaceae bacterium]|nr:family 43 glycosylhydrolase [Bacteroidaceae bacterium]